MLEPAWAALDTPPAPNIISSPAALPPLAAAILSAVAFH